MISMALFWLCFLFLLPSLLLHPVSLKYNWHTTLCKFKVYRIMVCITYVVKWSSQYLVGIHHLIYIQSKKTKKRKCFFSLWCEFLGWTLQQLSYRYTSFDGTSLYCTLQIEGLQQPRIEGVCWYHFPDSICSLCVSVCILAVLLIFQAFSRCH